MKLGKAFRDSRAKMLRYQTNVVFRVRDWIRRMHRNPRFINNIPNVQGVRRPPRNDVRKLGRSEFRRNRIRTWNFERNFCPCNAAKRGELITRRYGRNFKTLGF